ncbi:MAG TPA: OB-fold nucleic acid binding domain-containing protein, partial [Gammaproteobacteria bacterium]|nr:OB-fold nucleic acid binding domain-containing protein [Gammaproteobacteria bacterium]
MNGKYRTHLCEDIGIVDIGKELSVSGWVHRRRDHGGVIFIDLRDVSGILQLVFNPENEDLFKTAEKMRSEFVLSVSGVVRERPEGTINNDMKTGAVELLVESGEVLNASITPPFHHDEATNEDIRL